MSSGGQKKSAKAIRGLIRKVLTSALPRRLRDEFLRSLVKVNYDLPSDLTFKLAQTKDELLGAFRLLHNCYVNAGFMLPHPSGLRVTKYHALPSTSTLVALKSGQVIGTVSLIRRSAFGLPLDQIFDLNHLYQAGTRVVEVSALAVDPEFSGDHGEIMLLLMKFLYEYCVKFFGTDCLAIAVNPSWFSFYEGVLGFQRITKKTVRNYSFVNGAPAVGGLLDLRTARELFNQMYGHRPLDKNLFYYLADWPCSRLQFPDKTYHKISDPVLTPELMNEVFNERTKLFSEMTPYEIAILNYLYTSDEFRRLLPRMRENIHEMRKVRMHPRFDVHCVADIEMQKGHVVHFAVKCVSLGGIGGIVERSLRANQVYTVNIKVSSTKEIQLKVKGRWSNQFQYVGLEIVNAPKEWLTYIEELQNEVASRKAAG